MHKKEYEDIIADIKNLAETDSVRWDLIGMLALDLIGLIPVIGALKYSDEVGTLIKNAGKVSVVAEGADGVGAVTRHADEAGAVSYTHLDVYKRQTERWC